jgi:hypothetical protein
VVFYQGTPCTGLGERTRVVGDVAAGILADDEHGAEMACVSR